MNESELRDTVKAVDIEVSAGENLTLSHSERDATLYISRPDRTPLSVGEEHATITVSTDDGTVAITLDGEQLDMMADAIQHIQQFHLEGGPDE